MPALLSASPVAAQDDATLAALATTLSAPVVPTDDVDVLSVWDAVVSVVESTRFRNVTRNVLGAYAAASASTTPAAQVLPDVLQTTAERAAASIVDYVTTAVAWTLADDGADASETVSVNGVRLSGVVRAQRKACGTCAGCETRKTPGARRLACESPVVTYVAVTLARVVARVMRAVARDTFRADPTYAQTMDDAAWHAVAESTPVPATRVGRVPTDAARALLTVAARACAAAGVDVIAANGRASVDAGNALALTMGLPCTDRGRREAWSVVRDACPTA